MERATSKRTRHMLEDTAEPVPAYGNHDERIIIERRVVVAEVTATDDGEHPMLRAAFMAASDAIADKLRDASDSDSVEFVYGGHRFRAVAEPFTE